MKDEDIKDLVMTHDKSIGIMSQSMTHLAETVGTQIKKMEDILEELSAQNVLAEKFANMNRELKETFTRLYSRVEKIENSQDIDGCPVLKIEIQKVIALEKRMKTVEVESKKILNPTILKWIIGITIVQSAAFGTYLVSHIHALETTVATEQALEAEKHENLEEKIGRMDSLLNRNYGMIQGIRDGE